jgi:hypothetical protein
VADIFEFRFDPAYRIAALPFGVTPGTTRVEVTDAELFAKFGPWRVRTPISNVSGCEESGGYQRIKTMGPAHLSFTDRGLTFATNSDRGLCITFHEPVAGIEPAGRIRHPGLTVTVTHIAGLRAALTARTATQ